MPVDANGRNSCLQNAHGRRERRGGAERRRRTLWSLASGSFRRRRYGPRRLADAGLAVTDWYAPQWLAATVLILLLCLADALLTLALMQQGAHEVNPLMDGVVHGDGRSFAAVKFGLTAAGVMLLVLVARVRAFGLVPVGAVLYLVLAGYLGLVGYEFWLLRTLAPGFF